MIHLLVPAMEESDHNVPVYLLFYKDCFIVKWCRKVHPFTASAIIYTPSSSHTAILLKCWHWQPLHKLCGLAGIGHSSWKANTTGGKNESIKCCRAHHPWNFILWYVHSMCV